MSLFRRNFQRAWEPQMMWKSRMCHSVRHKVHPPPVFGPPFSLFLLIKILALVFEYSNIADIITWHLRTQESMTLNLKWVFITYLFYLPLRLSRLVMRLEDSNSIKERDLCWWLDVQSSWDLNGSSMGILLTVYSGVANHFCPCAVPGTSERNSTVRKGSLSEKTGKWNCWLGC